MEKRLLIAMALALVILFGFQKLYKPATPVAPTVQPQATKQAGAAETPAAPVAAKTEPLEEKEALEQTDKLNIVFSDIGGTIKRISLREYKGSEDQEYVLCEAPAGKGLFALKSEFLPNQETMRYQEKRGKNYTEYTRKVSEQIEITKRYNFYKSFNRIDLQVFIKNTSSKDAVFSYELDGPAGLLQADKVMGRTFLEADAMIDDKVVRKKAVKGAREFAGNIAWVAVKNRYFTLAVKPFTPPLSVLFKELPDKEVAVAIKSRNFTIKPGEATEDTYLIYAGPLKEKALAEIGYNMEGLIDYGFFGGVSKVLLSALSLFHQWTKNWGVAIILLTLLINAVLFPLTKKSVVSMHQMKTIQPHMQKLKELHKDNPQKLNKEMMELYKKYNVNPLSGCLPLLLQMPVFISLYQGLVRSVELKGAHFLWIKDLSRPDAVPLPVSLPFIGSSINILPLIMIGMMVVQQKISQGAQASALSGEQASQQKMMMTVFPLVFGFLFYSMPAGLVLYWLTNTILMTMEQKMLGKRLEQGQA